MQALTYSQYGPADVVASHAVPMPTPGRGEVLVNVRASTVNVIDNLIRAGKLGLPMVRATFPKTPGADLAGVVTAAGEGVTAFKPGDAVFGATSPAKGGAFADFVAVPAGALARKPTALSFEQAATLPITGLAALYALRELAQAQAGERVLIHGATGAAGLFAVQLAKQFGLHVTAVGSKGLERARELGADEVLDYRRQALKARPGLAGRFDIVIDFSTHLPFAAARPYLKPKGRFVEASPDLPKILDAKLLGPWRAQKHLILMTTAKTADLEYLAGLAASGRLQTTISRTYPMAQAASALAEMESHGAVGKIVLRAGDAGM
jgi:NADPH:quinone reductase-like Zn-dependent oxidoreductase